MSRKLGLVLLVAAFASLATAGGCAADGPGGPRPADSGAHALTQAAATEVLRADAPVRASFVGEGSLEAHGEKSGKTKLALQRVSVAAHTTGDVAEMTIEHVFRNDTDEILEGTFRFPMPEGAILTGLAMEIDQRLMEGELVERDKARKAYESIVDEMLDPALLEWEAGSTFKLRVFPIEAKKTKRVVLKLVAPLHRHAGGLAFAYRPPTTEAGVTLEGFTLTLDGKAIAPDASRTPSGEVFAPVAPVAPETFVERTKEGTYVVAHVAPSFSGAAPAPRANGQALIVLCDRSRSMLEERALQAKVATLLLSKLEARDRFTVITGDVKARAFGSGLHEPTDAERSAAGVFIDGVSPDGASDLGKLFEAARDAAKEATSKGLEPVFVYLGDATPSWGEARTSESLQIARGAFGSMPLHVVVLGKSADEATARALTSATHGRLLRPKTEADALRVSEQIVGARTTRRIDDVKLVTGDGVDVPLDVPGTLYEGDALDLAAFVPKDQEAKASMKVVGTIDGKAFEKSISVASATPARDVGKRWAKARIDKLEQEGDARKEAVVKTSLEHGVMSRYTSFLVLESEEAYARLQIARKAKVADRDDARVSGRDLDGSGDNRTASVTPDHLQPGDPEVRIPAPADAQSVVVVFPFGETKNAAFERDTAGGTWVVRFLVDAHTPDGSYEIVVRVTHKDGHVELLKLPYIVDTAQPNLDVKVRALSDGSYEIKAKQTISQAEIDALAPDAGGTLETNRRRYAAVLTDAKRVEVRAPDGQIIALTAHRLGEFAGKWKPRGPVAAGSKLRLVAVNRALNQRVTEAVLP